MEDSIKGQKKFDESEFQLYRVQFKLAFNAQQTLYNNNNGFHEHDLRGDFSAERHHFLPQHGTDHRRRRMWDQASGFGREA